jgi:predicted aspartyl protease
MTLVFKYAERNESGRTWKAPFIPVYVRDKNGNNMIVQALIDSGADGVIIPKIMAEFFGLEEGAISKSQGIGGVVTVKKSRITLTVNNENESYTLKLPARILQNEQSDIPMLLGRDVFFDHFHITFKQNEETIILERAEHGS